MASTFATSKAGHRTQVVAWTDFATAESPGDAYNLADAEGALASVQAAGTFGGATITLEVSNDGTNFHTAKDTTGSEISLTAGGLIELSTGARMIRPASSGGTADAVTVTLVMKT